MYPDFHTGRFGPANCFLEECVCSLNKRNTRIAISPEANWDMKSIDPSCCNSIDVIFGEVSAPMRHQCFFCTRNRDKRPLSTAFEKAPVKASEFIQFPSTSQSPRLTPRINVELELLAMLVWALERWKMCW